MRRVLSFITLVTRDHMGSLVGGRQMDKSCRESLVIVFLVGIGNSIRKGIMEKMGRRGERERRLEKEEREKQGERGSSSYFFRRGMTERAGWGGGRRYAGL